MSWGSEFYCVNTVHLERMSRKDFKAWVKEMIAVLENQIQLLQERKKLWREKARI